MKYRLTSLTPLLVGDGRRLAPIDYMVWKDQVNVLDQRRIFRLLARGPRLEGYLAQLKKAERLDFASWGGFAQNFADRRIPFEDPVYAAYWQKASGEVLQIPTFASGPAGPYLPGAAIKGALRTGMLFANWKSEMMREVAAKMQGERVPRHPAAGPEEQALGPAETDRMRVISVADSAPVKRDSMKIYLLRVASLQSRGQGQYSLGWKQSPRGTADGKRPEESMPHFAEMASPGTVFEGSWQEHAFFKQPEIRHALHWPELADRARIFAAANQYASRLLALHKQYAAWTGLELLAKSMADLEAGLVKLNPDTACMLPLGWGGGLVTKTVWLTSDTDEYHQILRNVPIYSKALSSGLPFPKTRRIVFLNNKPATLPGWAVLEVMGDNGLRRGIKPNWNPILT